MEIQMAIGWWGNRIEIRTVPQISYHFKYSLWPVFGRGDAKVLMRCCAKQPIQYIAKHIPFLTYFHYYVHLSLVKFVHLLG